MTDNTIARTQLISVFYSAATLPAEHGLQRQAMVKMGDLTHPFPSKAGSDAERP